jgi:restriction system protein
MSAGSSLDIREIPAWEDAMARHRYRRPTKGMVALWGFALVAMILQGLARHPLWLVPVATVAGAWVYWHYQRAQRRRALLLASGIAQIDQMSGVQFEERLLVHFQAQGWQVRPTRASGDFGADLVGTRPDGVRVVIQAKRWHGSVGVSAVQEVHAARNYYQAPYALLITNSTLTAPARELAARTGVDVWERDRLIQELGTTGLSSTRSARPSWLLPHPLRLRRR